MKKKKKKKVNIWKWFAVLVGLMMLLAVGGCAAVLSVGNALVDQGKVKEQIETTILYDNEEREVFRLYVEDRESVPYQEIPPIIVSAFVNVEDERFFTHQGLDPIAIARALYKDIRAGSKVEGASTITQQLAKNVYLTHEKSIWRKTKEAIIAVNLEQNYSKEQILEFYLNEIYFGDAVYGIKSAARYYFGKDDLNDLTLAEVATLAALPKAPNNYSPLKNYEKSLERRKVVLALMERNGSITKEEREAAANEELQLVGAGKGDQAIRAYVDYVLKEAQERFDLTENQLYRGGYQIYTEMDSKAQNAMIKAFDNPALFPKSKSKDPVQAGMVIMDPHTGGVVAMMGGREYVTKGLNRALTKRSPGSTFKPLAVYAPALEKGWNPYDMLKDEKMTFSGGYSPSNWNGDGYLGQVSMYDALKRSKNVPAVWLLNEIGIETSFRYLDRFGIAYDKQQDRQLGIALGGLTHGATPMEMAAAYSAFANNGVVIEPHAIVKIQDRDGALLQKDVATSTVVTEQTAYYMTKMLQAAVNEGTGKSAKMNRPVAGKTGTTQMEGTKGGNRDAWFVGYTPEYVGAIWMGYDKSNAKTNYLTEGSSVTAKFFRTVMTEALKGREVKSFTRPKGVKELEPPVNLQPITDLQATNTIDSIHLIWSPIPDERILYRIYRYIGDPANRELIGETEYSEWIDMGIQSTEPIHYFVVPYDTQNRREGSASNVVSLIPQPISDPELAPPMEEGTEGEGEILPPEEQAPPTEPPEVTPIEPTPVEPEENLLEPPAQGNPTTTD
ncbi:transglycosylase domain-containing protein [Ammoniphilus sp. CFH 90114]|uniref:transglycosylase domain-containing protein n=1 Tax=Ammoniphilus sp. CFH 90114 TaxID=2493665 RepID=UPI0013E95FC8|nr:PBP1A family penicillin-binding protein [Ammoniphilus sp. CFH 90114]